MSQPESRIVTAVLQRIRDLGGHAVKTHPAGGTAGTPDVIGTINGRALALEVKRPTTRNHTTPQQRHQIDLWGKAGAIAGVVCSADEAEQLIASRRHTLAPVTALEVIEQAMRDGQEEHGNRWTTKPALHHMKKGLGHALAAGPTGTHVDDDSGHPHLALAATRLVLALAVTLDRKATP